MHLQTPTTSFHLQIVGYEFPDLQPHHNNPYDPDWLLIRITATTLEGTWTVTDPSLLTSEVSYLIDWLTSLTTTPDPDTSLGFTEPDISFDFIQSTTLHVHLAAECKPPWSRNTSQDTILTFSLSDLDLTTTIQSLRSQLAQFPPRTL